MNANVKSRYADIKVKVDGNYGPYTPYLHQTEILSDLNKPSCSIAQFNRIRGKNHLLEMTQPKKMFYGYRTPKTFPRVTYALGSSEYTNIGTDRAVGPCKHGGRSAFYTYPSDKQKPIFRNKDIRLQFPHFQQMVCDVIQQPPKMYGEYSQKISRNLVL